VNRATAPVAQAPSPPKASANARYSSSARRSSSILAHSPSLPLSSDGLTSRLQQPLASTLAAQQALSKSFKLRFLCGLELLFFKIFFQNKCICFKDSMVPTYAAFLEICCNTKNLHKLQQLHSQTIKLGISYNDFIAKLISSYAACAQMANAILFSFTNRKCTFLYNTLIKGYASSKEFHLSLASFHQMIPTVNSLTATLFLLFLNLLLPFQL
ncbi:hypothetical protein RDABS01_015363, partial [Bienertia sinuspersici]